MRDLQNLLNNLRGAVALRGAGVIGCLGTGLLIITFVAIAFVLHQKETEAQMLEAEVAAMEESAERTLEVARALENQIGEHQTKLADLRARVPKHADVSVFLREVALCFEENKLQLRDFRPGAKTSYDNLTEVELMIRAEGSYGDLCNALDDLLQMPWHTRITHLALTGQPDRENLVGIDISVAVSTELKL